MDEKYSMGKRRVRKMGKGENNGKRSAQLKTRQNTQGISDPKRRKENWGGRKELQPTPIRNTKDEREKKNNRRRGKEE